MESQAGVPAKAGGNQIALYAFQGELPSLPVPSLAETCDKLLRSIRPLVDEESYAHAESVVRDFQKGTGPELQSMLEERAKESRNWLEEWWEEFLYLRPRYPIAVWINWQGTAPFVDWRPYDLTQTEAAAITIRHTLLFREQIVKETMEVERLAGRPLCMHQFSRMYNSCRVPGEECDSIVTYPNDKRHIAILRNNCIFVADVLDEHGSIISLSDLMWQIDDAIRRSSSPYDLDHHPPMSVLTSENRTTWAKLRQRLIDMDAVNRQSIDAIESALFCLVLERASPVTLEQRSYEALLGSGRNKWYDKPVNTIIYANGLGSVNGEHTWADAMVVVKQQDFIMRSTYEELASSGKPRKHATMSAGVSLPTLLSWKLDNEVITSVEAASSNIRSLINKIDLRVLEFPHYGRSFIKRYKFTPDFYMQMAIQLAYWRLHNEVVATYETAHTRLFYHGRTETTRSTSVESVAFCKAMSPESGRPQVSDAEKFDKLKAAIEAHGAYVKDAMMGKGIDRHLLGLQIVAEIQGITPKPALFTDPSYIKSRHFVLSTSNVAPASSHSFGGFSPFFPGGYGVCYAMTEHGVNVCITSVKATKTDAVKYRAQLEEALVDMQKLCLTRNIIYIGAAKL